MRLSGLIDRHGRITDFHAVAARLAFSA